jgi:ABC-type dipeptide/oligopeptide/nickel transport system permease component
MERVHHTAVRGAARAPFAHAAHARGLRRHTLFFNYLVRPALNPVVSVLGPLLAASLSRSLVLEQIFAWPGLGLVT